MKTLLIDDDAFSLHLLGLQLKNMGCTDVIECDRAEEALHLLDTEQVDLVFCDLQMPDLDGVQYVRHLASIGYAGALVLVSGEDDRVLQTVKKLAAAHHIRVLAAIQKPVAMQSLRAILGALENSTNLSPRSTLEQPRVEALKRAMDCHELVVHYQPKVNLVSGDLIGVEALVRWQPPNQPMIFPDQFISMAEDSQLIDELTRIVLQEAFSQSRRWREDGMDMQVAVNISMDTLASLDFPDAVVSIAGQTGVDLTSVILEITESRLMKDQRTPLDILTRLRLKHISLSIDDFGTGHSSLVQLRDIPFNELKLDRSFINGAATNPALGAIVEATLSMARQLGMKSVAEGVEDQADWDFLRERHCDVAQGYFIARPMPGDQIMSWHADWTQRRQTLVHGLN